ncbi:MAG TPA: cobalt-precorrin-6A reductase [Acidimicrobiales bacterium]
MSGNGSRVLVLGGSGEADELARALAQRGQDVTVSLLGTARTSGTPPYRRRVGPFGGVTGLVGELERGRYRLLVDATHPFAAQMPMVAARAASLARVPRVRIVRPPWTPGPDDAWQEVDDLAGAARRLGELGRRRVFLSIGVAHLDPFAGLDVQPVVRSIEPPTTLPLRGATVVVGRAPFSLDAELALLSEHRIEVLVARNSGGHATAAKLEAARRLGLAVVMVRRPPLPPGDLVETVGEALVWVQSRLG